jgi:DNA replication protein DnaC
MSDFSGTLRQDPYAFAGPFPDQPAGTVETLRAQADAAGGNAFTNSFTGARIGNEANTLAAEASSLRGRGDPASQLQADQLMRQSDALHLRSRAYAAPVGRYEDVRLGDAGGLDRAGSYIAGQVGQGIGSSVDMLASGSALGGAATLMSMAPHPMVNLVGKGLRAASVGVPYMQNVALNKGEAYRDIQDDPVAMARSAQDIDAEMSKHGYIAGAMDTLPQLMPIGQIGGGFSRSLKKVPTSGKLVGTALGEGVTETGQEISKHYAHEALNPNRDTSGDVSALQNSFLGGMLGGGGMAAIGHVGEKVLSSTRSTNQGADPGQEVDLSGLPGAPSDPGAPVARERVTPRMTPDLDATLSGQPPDHIMADPDQTRTWMMQNMAERPAAVEQHLAAMAQDGDSRAAALHQELGATPPDTPEQDQVLNTAYQHIVDQQNQVKASPKGQRSGFANAFATVVGKAGDGFIKGFEATGNKLVDATHGKKNLQGFDTSGYDEWEKRRAEATINTVNRTSQERRNPSDYVTVTGTQADNSVAKKKSRARAQGLADRMTDEGVNTLDVILRSRAELMGDTLAKETEKYMAHRVQQATHVSPDEDGKTELMRTLGYEVADLAHSWSMTPEVGPKEQKNADKRITHFDGLKSTLHSIVQSIKINTGPNAAKVLSQLRTQADPAAAPLFDMMDAELTIQGSPQAKAHAAQIHDEAKDALLMAIPVEKRHALAKAGVNVESEDGRSALLTMVSMLARNQLEDTAAARKELSNHLGKNTVTSLVDLMIPANLRYAERETTESIRATGTETVSEATVNDETGEYEVAGENDTGKTSYDQNSNAQHVAAINEPIYNYYQNNTLATKKGGFLADTGGLSKTEKLRRQDENNQRLAAGEPPLPVTKRPRLFHYKDGKPTQQVMNSKDMAVDRVITGMEEKLGIDRSTDNMIRLLKIEKNRAGARHVMALAADPSPEAQAKLKEINEAFFDTRAGSHRVVSRSAGEILKAQGTGQVSILSMHHDYLHQDATRLRAQAAKIAKTTPDKAKAMLAEADALDKQGQITGRVLNDMLDSKQSRVKRMTPEQHAQAHKAAAEYFDNHHVVVAEELANRDNSRMTPTEFLKLVGDGDRAVSYTRIDGKHIGEKNLLTFDSPRLSPHKDGKVNLTAGSIVNWVLQQRGDMYEQGVEKSRKGKQFNAKVKNREYLDALMEGIAVMVGSGLVKGLPTKINIKGEAEAFGMKNQALVDSAQAKKLIADNLAKQQGIDPAIVAEAQEKARIAALRAEQQRHGAPPSLMLDNATAGDMEFGAKNKHESANGETEGKYGHQFAVGVAMSLSRLTPETMNKEEQAMHAMLLAEKEAALKEAERLKDADSSDMDTFAQMNHAFGEAMVAIGRYKQFMSHTASTPARLKAVKADVKAAIAAAEAEDAKAAVKSTGDEAVSRLFLPSQEHKAAVRAEAEKGSTKIIRTAYLKLVAESAQAAGLRDGDEDATSAEQLKKNDFFVPEQRTEIPRGEVRDQNYVRHHMLTEDERDAYIRLKGAAAREKFINETAVSRVIDQMESDESWKGENFDEKTREQQTALIARTAKVMHGEWMEEFSLHGPFGAMMYEKSGLSSDTKLVKNSANEGGLIVPGRVGNASSGTFHPESTARKITDTPLDNSKGQDKRTADDEFTAQQEHSEMTGFNAGKTAGVVGGEKKKSALIMVAQNAADTISALTSNLDSGIQMLRQRLRTAQTAAFHKAEKGGPKTANMAVGSLHYAVPAAYILTEERISNLLDDGATKEQMMEMHALRVETARVLMDEKGAADMKLGATRMLLGLDRDDKSITSLTFKQKLAEIVGDAKPMDLAGGYAVAETTRAQQDSNSNAAIEQFRAQREEMDAALAEGRMPREIKLNALQVGTKQVGLRKTPLVAERKVVKGSAAWVRQHRTGVVEAMMANNVAKANAIGPKQPNAGGLGVGRTPKTKPGTNESWSQAAVDRHTARTAEANGRGTPAPDLMVDNKLVSREGKGTAKIDYSDIQTANDSLNDKITRMNRAETEWALAHRLELVVKVDSGSDFGLMLEDEIELLKAHLSTLPEVAKQKIEGKPVSAERQAVRDAARARAAAAPAAPAAPVKSSRSVATLAMNYKDGQDPVHVMRPEFRGKDTMDLILSGARTATTGAWDRVKALVKGDVFTVTGNGKTALVRATTDPYHTADVTAEQWSQMEGWAPSVYNSYKNSYQIQYELVKDLTPAATPADTINVWHGTDGKGPYAHLSNLAARPFTFNDRNYVSVEHAYQSNKSGKFDQATYDKYKTAGRKISGTLPPKIADGWNLRLMKSLVQRSFDQNPEAAAKLKATGDSKLTHTQETSTWKNEFPRILTEVRAELGQERAVAAKPPAATGPASYTNHSGGAHGADSMFDTVGKTLGFTKHKHYWHGRPTPLGNVQLDDAQVDEGINHAKAAAAVLRRPWNDKYASLLGRNWFQVKNATQVVAIAPLIQPGEKDAKGFTSNARRTTVGGGTGYAVEMAIGSGKEVHVFDTKTNQWFTYADGQFIKSSTPTLAKNYAGIGSRQEKGTMTPESIQAIRDVYEKASGKQPGSAPAPAPAPAQPTAPDRDALIEKYLDEHASSWNEKPVIAHVRDLVRAMRDKAEKMAGNRAAIVSRRADFLWSMLAGELSSEAARMQEAKEKQTRLGRLREKTDSDSLRLIEEEIAILQNNDVQKAIDLAYEAVNNGSIQKPKASELVGLTPRDFNTREENRARLQSAAESFADSELSNRRDDERQAELDKYKGKDVLEMRKDADTFVYTQDQADALKGLVDAMSNISKGNDWFLLNGKAGTGKTTIVENIINAAHALGRSVFVMAPTNKAVQVLSGKLKAVESKISDIGTLHKLMYEAPYKDHKTGKLIFNDLNMEFVAANNATILMDEASMISDTELKKLREQFIGTHVQFILLGDQTQLEPVGIDPKLFTPASTVKFKQQFVLNEVRRQALESNILKYATVLAANQKLVVPENGNYGDLTVMPYGAARLSAIKGIAESPKDSVALVTTNNDRIEVNGMVRAKLFGDASAPLTAGEPLIGVANGETVVNSETFLAPKITGDGSPVTLQMEVNERGQKVEVSVAGTIYNTERGELLLIPRLPTPSVGKDVLDNVRGYDPAMMVATYAYALTTHKSQGSQWANVYVLPGWMSPSWAGYRLVYTAVTRASKNVVVGNSPKVFGNATVPMSKIEADTNAYIAQTAKPGVRSGGRKLNAQVAADPSVSPGDTATPTAREQALNIAKASAWAGKVLAKDIRVAFKDTLGFSGEWLSVPRIINIAKDAASGILGAMHHEGLHAFFTDFIANEPKAIEIFKSITENAEIKARVHALLDGYPAAQAQLSSPEEVLAYAFQFWKAGMLELPYGKPKTFFQKVQKFIREVLNNVSDYERATDLLAAFDEGQMKTQDAGKAVIAKIMAQGTWSLKARRAMDKFSQAAAEAIIPAEAMLREDRDSAEARKVGLQLFTNPGDETSAGHKEGYVQAHMHAARRAVSPFMWALKGMNPTDHIAIEKYMQAETPLEKIPYAPHRAAVEAIRANNDEFHRYLTEDRGMQLGYAGKKGYYPVVWSVTKLADTKDKFTSMLTTKYAAEMQKIMKVTKLETPEEAAAAIHAAIINRKGMDEKLNVQREDGVLAPYFANEESRTLNWIEAEDREPFLSKDLISTMTSYYNHGAHAAEYAHRFGRKGEALDVSLKKIKEEMTASSEKRFADGEFENEAARVAWLARKMRGVEHAIGAQVGTLGNDVTDRVRKLNSYAMVYQNFRLLATVLFASFADPTGMVANGAPVAHAFKAFMTAMTEVMRSWANMFRTEKKEYRENYFMKLGEMTGAIEHAVVSHHVSEEYSSTWLNPLAKKLNDILFKANGMEAFDRGMRAGAMEAAVAFLLHHKTHPEKHSERWLKNLGIPAHKIPVNSQGQLIVTPNELMLEREMDDTPENRAAARKEIGLLYDALNRWVEGSIMSPNAAHRPAWGSDPHYAAMFHLKQFTYTWHQTVLKHARQEAAHGNMAPLGAIAGIVPVTLMSGVMKGLFLGGGSMPDNMAGMTFGQHMERAVQAAGVGGVGQLLGHTALHPLSAGGPMIEQVLGGAYDLITGNASGAKVAYDALPLHQLVQGLNPIK